MLLHGAVAVHEAFGVPWMLSTHRLHCAAVGAARNKMMLTHLKHQPSHQRGIACLFSLTTYWGKQEAAQRAGQKDFSTFSKTDVAVRYVGNMSISVRELTQQN